MTVVDRDPAALLPGSLATQLHSALGTARRATGRRPLAWTSMGIEPLDPIALFAAARAVNAEAALLLQPAGARSIVGIGRAWAVEPGGAGRFTEAADAWRAVVAGAVGSNSAPGPASAGPTLIGGLGFSGRIPANDDPWAAFGAASLVLPKFAVSGSGPSATLTVAVAPGDAERLEPVDLELAWQALADEARVRHAGWDATPIQSSLGPERPYLRIIEELPDRAKWERTVGMFAGAVGRGRIDKVVLARRVILRADEDLDVVGALRRLAESAPESTTFAFARDGQVFLGASPERLVRTEARAFETVAIAGSAPRGADAQEDAHLAGRLLASEKEREEHAVVADELRASLLPITETLHVDDSPAVLRLRHVQHLATRVTGTLRAEAGLLALAARLHPTPAVGGAPRDVALALIDEHEGFDRGWYAGPIGWLGADGDGELMVALRCGLVAGPEAMLYAGCGIVADSDPPREWDESRLKLRTMTTALGDVMDGEA